MVNKEDLFCPSLEFIKQEVENEKVISGINWICFI